MKTKFEFTAEITPFYDKGVKVLVLNKTDEKENLSGIIILEEHYTSFSEIWIGEVYANNRKQAEELIEKIVATVCE